MPKKLDYTFTGDRPDHISASQIDTGKCLYKYLVTRLQGKYREPSEPMTLGTVMHQIIYRYTDLCFKNGFDSDFDALNKIIDIVFDAFHLSESQYKELRNNAILFGERGIDTAKILEYEKNEKVCIGQDESGTDIIVEVVIDRVNSYRDTVGSVLEIIDYKNSMNILTKQQVEEHEQLNIYKYIACQHLYPGFDYVRSGIWHTRYNFCRWTDLKSVKDLSDDFENTEKYLIRQWDRLHNGTEYEPMRCESCFKYSGCEVMAAGACPLWTKVEVDKLKKGSIQDRVRALKKLDFDTKDLKSKVSTHFKSAEVETIDNKVVGYSANLTYEYDLDKFIKYCNAKMIPIAGMTITKTQAEKTIEKNKKIKTMDEKELADVKEMQITKASSRFNF